MPSPFTTPTGMTSNMHAARMIVTPTDGIGLFLIPIEGREQLFILQILAFFRCKLVAGRDIRVPAAAAGRRDSESESV